MLIIKRKVKPHKKRPYFYYKVPKFEKISKSFYKTAKKDYTKW